MPPRVAKRNAAADEDDFDGEMENGTTAKRTRKTKKEKDPDMPKRPLSSYLLFCEEFRDKVRKENPSLKITDVMKELSARWRGLSDHEKQKYTDKAAEGKKNYDELKKKILKKRGE